MQRDSNPGRILPRDRGQQQASGIGRKRGWQGEGGTGLGRADDSCGDIF